MSDDEGFRPAPLVLDASVLIEAVRGDAGVMTLLQGYDADGQPLILPVLAVTAASLDMRSEDAEAILHGLERLENAMAAPVRDAEQACPPGYGDRRDPLGSPVTPVTSGRCGWGGETVRSR